MNLVSIQYHLLRSFYSRGDSGPVLLIVGLSKPVEVFLISQVLLDAKPQYDL